MSLIRAGAVFLLLTVSAACGSSGPTSPTATPPPAPSYPTSTRSFPPPTGASRTFVFDRELGHPVSDYTRLSRVVLYDNGALLLQYVGLGDYRGGYSESNGAVTLDLDAGVHAAHAWLADATLSRETLTVRYNFDMNMSGFEDAVYRFVP